MGFILPRPHESIGNGMTFESPDDVGNSFLKGLNISIYASERMTWVNLVPVSPL